MLNFVYAKHYKHKIFHLPDFDHVCDTVRITLSYFFPVLLKLLVCLGRKGFTRCAVCAFSFIAVFLIDYCFGPLSFHLNIQLKQIATMVFSGICHSEQSFQCTPLCNLLVIMTNTEMFGGD